MTIHLPLPPELQDSQGAASPARVVSLSERQTAIFFDAEASLVSGGTRIAAICDGRPFDGPVAVTRLDRQQGGVRHVLLVARPAAQICGAGVRIEANGLTLARIDPLALQSPLVDPLSLVSGLDESGGLRLLKLLLTTGASLFGKGELGGFGALVGQLLENLTAVPLAAWCPVGRGPGVLSWRLPAEVSLPALRDLCILHEGRARRFTEFTALEETAGAEKLLHLFFSRPLPSGADLIVLGEQPIRLGGPVATAARPFQSWLERRNAETRVRALDWLDDQASRDAQIAALRDELACPTGAEPRLQILHLSETAAGLLFLLSVDDPRGLLAAVRFSVPGGATDLPVDGLEWHPTHGAVLAGFAELRGRSGGSVSAAPVFLSGRVGEAIEAAPTTFDGRVPEVFGGLAEIAAAPALARALPAAMQARPIWRRRVTEFGALPATPGVAVVIAAGEAPEYLHAAVSSLLAEPGGSVAEIVVHHADGPASELIRSTVASLSAVHRAGIRLVSVASEAFPSERFRAALAETRAAKVLAIGPGALPSAPGWLASWRRRIAAGSTPAIVWVAATGCDGASRGDADAVGLSAAAVGRLVSARPLLPNVGPDLRSAPGVEQATARGLGVTVYEHAPDSGLARAAEQLAADAAREAANV